MKKLKKIKISKIKNLILSIPCLLIISYTAVAQNTKWENNVNLGVLGIEKIGNTNNYVYLVDLTNRDDKTNSHICYYVYWPKCPLEIGSTYKGFTEVSENKINIKSIIFNGFDVKFPPFPNAVVSKVSTWFINEKILPNGGHWEWENGKIVAKDGTKESIKWKAAKERKNVNLNLPMCYDHFPFYNEKVKLIITVKPENNKKWTFDEAPELVTKRIMSNFNSNSSSIHFEEANGEKPDFEIKVTISENREGTPRYSAYAEFIFLEKADLLKANSGENTFTVWGDAIDKLSTNMLTFFINGWHTNRPCLQFDGVIRE